MSDGVVLGLTVDEEYELSRDLARSIGDMLELLNERARLKGITAEQIAEHLDWDVDDVRAIQGAHADPRLSELQNYARALRATLYFEVAPYWGSQNGGKHDLA